MRRALWLAVAVIVKGSNVLTGGLWEWPCARAHRRGWVAYVVTVDGIWAALGGEQDHCRQCHQRQQDRQAPAPGSRRITYTIFIVV